MRTIAIIAPNLEEFHLVKQFCPKSADIKYFWIGGSQISTISELEKVQPVIIILSLNFETQNIKDDIESIRLKHNVPIFVYKDDIFSADKFIFDALNAGADDYAKINNSQNNLQNEEFKRKLEKFINTHLKFSERLVQDSKISIPKKRKFIVIGSSTGGPQALMDILTKMPLLKETTIIIVQHIEADYVTSLSEWLNSNTINNIEIAQADTIPEKGKIYISDGDRHLIISKSEHFQYTDEPKDYPYKPSVNIFFESIAQIEQFSGIAVILTGMGRDGALGLLKLKEKKWQTIAQDESSSIVYGMPKAAFEIGAVKLVLSIEEIANKLAKYAN